MFPPIVDISTAGCRAVKVASGTRGLVVFQAVVTS